MTVYSCSILRYFQLINYSFLSTLRFRVKNYSYLVILRFSFKFYVKLLCIPGDSNFLDRYCSTDFGEIKVITPPDRRVWQSFKFVSFLFFPVSKVGLLLMGNTAGFVICCLAHCYT